MEFTYYRTFKLSRWVGLQITQYDTRFAFWWGVISFKWKCGCEYDE